MRKFRPSLVAGALALAFFASTASAQFTNTYIFGDSLSDAGQYGSRFTTNPGLIASMYLGQSFGLTATPSFQGGNDFAQGGARVNSPSPLIPAGVPNLSITQQVSQYLSKGPVDPNALYQIQGGANDILVLVQQAAAGNPAGAAGLGRAGGPRPCHAVGRLRAAGAQYIVLQNLPDIGKTPFAAAQGARSTFTALSGLFNSTLNTAIGDAGLQVIQFNTSALLSEIIAKPGLYGFINTTVPVCTTASALNCTPSTLRDPTGNLTYVFADGVHPTTGADLLLAQALVSMITGPQQMAALGEAPIDIERANWRTLDGRMMSGMNAKGGPASSRRGPRTTTPTKTSSGPGLSGKRRPQHDLGGRRHAGDRQDPRRPAVRLLRVQGRLRQRQRRLQAARADAHGLRRLRPGTVVRRRHVRRRLARLQHHAQHPAGGDHAHRERRSTNGYHNVVRLLGGYWFSYQDWDHGPFAKLTYEKIVVRQFSENGNDSTALTYDQQKVRIRSWSSLGWQVTGNVSGFRPFARATWEYNFDGDTRQVTAKSNGLNGTYIVPGFQQDDNWWLFDLGRQPGVRQGHRLPRRQRVGRQGRRRLLGGHPRHSRPVVATRGLASASRGRFPREIARARAGRRWPARRTTTSTRRRPGARACPIACDSACASRARNAYGSVDSSRRSASRHAGRRPRAPDSVAAALPAPCPSRPAPARRRRRSPARRSSTACAR